jgi:hypothetical protein
MSREFYGCALIFDLAEKQARPFNPIPFKAGFKSNFNPFGPSLSKPLIPLVMAAFRQGL